MKNLLLLLLPLTVPVTSWAEDPPAKVDLRVASPAQLLALTNKLSKSLLTCAYARRNKDVAVNLSNATEDYIEKEPIEAALRKTLKLKPGGNKIKLAVKVSSAKSQRGNEFESRYEMNAFFDQQGKKFCEKSASFTNKGTVN